MSFEYKGLGNEPEKPKPPPSPAKLLSRLFGKFRKSKSSPIPVQPTINVTKAPPDPHNFNPALNPPELNDMLGSPFVTDTLAKLFSPLPKVSISDRKDQPGLLGFVDDRQPSRAYITRTGVQYQLPLTLSHEIAHSAEDLRKGKDPEFDALLDDISKIYMETIFKASESVSQDMPISANLNALANPSEMLGYAAENAILYMRQFEGMEGDLDMLRMLEERHPGTIRVLAYMKKKLPPSKKVSPTLKSREVK